MKALTLAAGQSTRLRPLTATLPKCLLPVGNKTILDHQIEALIVSGITELTIVVGFEAEQIKNHLRARAYPLTITYIENTEYKTTQPALGGLFLAKKCLAEPVLFFHCDVLFDAQLVQELLAHPSETVFPYRKSAWDEEAGKIVVNEMHEVTELGKHISHAHASGEYLQIAKFGKDFAAAIITVLTKWNESGKDSYTIDVFNEALTVTQGPAVGLPFTGTALEIDTIADYELAKQTWNK